ncbi:methylated-DNA--protein-cysteine methyltransferase-like isoform X2 [Babylonia areolata]|uniref:methylated-DNA--protein-cysteine methyltransferase-like isoform X2 n=1 Tax=Babylonia areolata TaxID=304850 RepID=UPI003FD2B127
MLGIFCFRTRPVICNMAGTVVGKRDPVIGNASSSPISKLKLKPACSKAKKVCHHGPTNTFIVTTPIGEIIIISCPRGLHCVTQNAELHDCDFKPERWCRVDLKSQLYCDNGYTYTPSLQCIQWLKNYFNKEHNEHLPAICPSVSGDGSFAAKVWMALIDAAPFGTTISYKGLSEAAGSKNASQAVGQAMAKNPFMLVVPCHRVIKSDGTLGNYAQGRRNSVKQWLIKFESGEI